MGGDCGHNYLTLEEALEIRGDYWSHAERWVKDQRWPRIQSYDSDDEDPSAQEFFKCSANLHRVTQTVLDKQQRSGEVPRYEKEEDVDENLWDHIAYTIVTVTLKADPKHDQVAPDGEEELEGALAMT